MLVQVLHPYLFAVLHKELVLLPGLLPLLAPYVSPQSSQLERLHLLLHRLVVLVAVRFVLVVGVRAPGDMGVSILVGMRVVFLMWACHSIFIHVVVLICKSHMGVNIKVSGRRLLWDCCHRGMDRITWHHHGHRQELSAHRSHISLIRLSRKIGWVRHLKLRDHLWLLNSNIWFV
jgi:hypothetical protein